MKAIITYHSIDPSGSVVSVHPNRFRAHVDILEQRGVPVRSLADLLTPHVEEGVSITFDDGFENLASVAWPVLRERGLPATVFVATDWVGGDNGWDPHDSRIPRLPLMDWTTLAELAQEGLAIGSHSATHASLPSLADGDLDRELEASRSTIRERIGSLPLAFAYPFGDYDDRVARAVEYAGYACAVTTELRPLRSPEPAAFALPRVDAYYLAKPGVMEAWGTPAFARYLVARRAARRIRGTLRALARRSR